MLRRNLVIGGLSASVLTLHSLRSQATSENAGKDQRIFQDDLPTSLPLAFPFELIETDGESALSKWTDLKKMAGVSPVVAGGRTDVERLLDGLAMDADAGSHTRSVDSLLEAAAALNHPEDLRSMRASDEADACARLKEWLSKTDQKDIGIDILDHSGNKRPMTKEEILTGCDEVLLPEVGDWPLSAPGSPGLTVANDVLSGRPLKKVYIALVPTNDWTTVPVHLKWGNWNANPPPEYHVAALRSWRDRYGAELVGLTGDTMNLRVSRKPQSRDEALSLAREQYDYCNDIVNQGLGTLSNLAAYTLDSDWWYFWWD